MRAIETSGDRFFRPADPKATRRNYRRVQAHKVLTIAANAVVALILAMAGFWLWQRTMSDRRFAIREIEAVGATHTPRAQIDAITGAYMGRNLFRLDIDDLKRELARLPWVASVAIEKKLPAKLTVHVTERAPVALVTTRSGVLRYADADGVVFAELGPESAAAALPVISRADESDVRGCVQFLEALRASAPELYGRLSEVSTEEGGTFRLFDRELKTWVLVDPADAAEKWHALYGIAKAEGYEVGGIEYADLRFDHRVVIKPRAGSGLRERGAMSAPAGDRKMSGAPVSGRKPGNA